MGRGIRRRRARVGARRLRGLDVRARRGRGGVDAGARTDGGRGLRRDRRGTDGGAFGR